MDEKGDEADREADIREIMRTLKGPLNQMIRCSIRNMFQFAIVGRSMDPDIREKWVEVFLGQVASEPWWDSGCEELFRELVTGR